MRSLDSSRQASGLWSSAEGMVTIRRCSTLRHGARNGVMAVDMVKVVLTGVDDVLDGIYILFIAPSIHPKPEEMVRIWKRFTSTETAIKTFSVGHPIESPWIFNADVAKAAQPHATECAHPESKPPTNAMGIVGEARCHTSTASISRLSRWVKGAVSFNDSHDVALMHDPKILSSAPRWTPPATRR